MSGLNYPYVGLRTYTIDESLIFFGRDKQILELIKRLKSSRFLAIVGTSGSGKSSLVRAGLLAKLEAGYISDLYSNWDLITITPGTEPLQNLITALQRNIAFDEKSKHKINRDYDIVDSLKNHYRKSESALLLLVDQFEEIFRFSGTGLLKKESDSAYVQLLLELSQIPGVPIYVILTMRSEFLGHSSIYPGLPEAINNGQYLIPRLNRQEKEEAIVGPARLFNKDVDFRLLDFVLNDLYNEKYALPLMQHFMMRLWSECENETVLMPPEDFKKNMTQRSLQQHIEEIYAYFDKDEKRITEKLFKILTTNSKGNWVRRPTPLKMILEICQEPQKKIIKVIDELRREQCNFLMPKENMPLNESTTIDITHESLIHNWARLKVWAVEDDKAVIAYTEALSRANRFEENPKSKNYLSEYDYHHYLRWIKKNRPNKAWVVLNFRDTNTKDKLGKDFEKTLQYINKSGRHIAWKRRRQRLIFITLVVLAVIAFSYQLYKDGLKAENKINQANEREKFERNIAMRERKRADSVIMVNKALIEAESELKFKIKQELDSLYMKTREEKIRIDAEAKAEARFIVKFKKDSVKENNPVYSKLLAKLTKEIYVEDWEKLVYDFAKEDDFFFKEIPIEWLVNLRDQWEGNYYLGTSEFPYRLAQDFGAAIKIEGDSLYFSDLSFPPEANFEWQYSVGLTNLLKELDSTVDYSHYLMGKPHYMVTIGDMSEEAYHILISNPFTGDLIKNIKVDDYYVDYKENRICIVKESQIANYDLSSQNDYDKAPKLLKDFQIPNPFNEKRSFGNAKDDYAGDFGPNLFAVTNSTEIFIYNFELKKQYKIKLEDKVKDDFQIELLYFDKTGESIYLFYDKGFLDYQGFEIDVVTGRTMKSDVTFEEFEKSGRAYVSSTSFNIKNEINLSSLWNFLREALKDYE